MQRLHVYQALWAMEHRRPGEPQPAFADSFDRVKAAGFDGMAIDLGALTFAQARETVPHFARTGLGGLLTAFPRSIEELRPALHLAKEIGAPFVVVIGQVMPISVAGMIPVVREWLRIADEERMKIQFETHRNCITNDLFPPCSCWMRSRRCVWPPIFPTMSWTGKCRARRRRSCRR